MSESETDESTFGKVGDLQTLSDLLEHFDRVSYALTREQQKIVQDGFALAEKLVYVEFMDKQSFGHYIADLMHEYMDKLVLRSEV